MKNNLSDKPDGLPEIGTRVLIIEITFKHPYSFPLVSSHVAPRATAGWVGSMTSSCFHWALGQFTGFTGDAVSSLLLLCAQGDRVAQ